MCQLYKRGQCHDHAGKGIGMCSFFKIFCVSVFDIPDFLDMFVRAVSFRRLFEF